MTFSAALIGRSRSVMATSWANTCISWISAASCIYRLLYPWRHITAYDAKSHDPKDTRISIASIKQNKRNTQYRINHNSNSIYNLYHDTTIPYNGQPLKLGSRAFEGAPGFWVHRCTHRFLGLKHRLGVRVFQKVDDEWWVKFFRWFLCIYLYSCCAIFVYNFVFVFNISALWTNSKRLSFC